jgi:cytochrome c oxidase subunit 2
MDMIPGRENIMKIVVQKPGTYRGQCAEYCGGAHALMSMYSVAMPPLEFATWMESEGGDAILNKDSVGKRIFIANGCGSCHTVRGTSAAGEIGPDLTHVGSRISIGAGVLRTNKDNFAAWISRHHKIKPDILMPRFEYLTEQELELLAQFLSELK